MLSYFERLVNPYPDTPPDSLPRGFFSFLWACMHGLRRYIFAITALTAIIGAFEALLFSMLGHIVDWLGQHNPKLFWVQEKHTLLTLAAVLLFSPIVIWFHTLLKHQAIAANFPMLLRWNFHRIMLDQSMRFFQDEFSGRIATKVMQTALATRDTILVVTDILVFVSIYFVTMVLILGQLHFYLVIPYAVWLSLYLIAMRFIIPRLGTAARAQADARSLMTGRITDAYTNINTVKLFSHARREASYARSAMQDFMVTAYRQMRLVSGLEVTNHTLSMALIVASTSTGIWLWSQGLVGVGAVAAAGAMALRLNGMSHWMMWEMATLFEHVGTVQDGINTLTKIQAIKDQPNATQLQVTQGEIQFKNVSFSYAETDTQETADSILHVIENFSLTIRPGEKIGLVGRSGAGKSTILNLLLRFYDINHGQILIDGQNIAGVTQESLRAQIGMVTQDTALLHRSVRDNILYGKPDALDQAMQTAAEQAHADTFIQTLSDPYGRTAYDAHVGERGVKLSGGQRQRIAIARVMLKNAPILLLDEATSALDSEVEAAIQESLYRLMENKTVVAVAHRLSTIAAMDRLIVVDGGRIVEEGDHTTLLARNGLYARLWAHQSGGFLGEDI